jgi:hypothetical protein
MRAFAPALALVTSCAATPDGWPPPRSCTLTEYLSALRCSLDAPEPEVIAGDPVRVRYTLRNISSDTLHIKADDLPGSNSLSKPLFAVRRRDGIPVKHEGLDLIVDPICCELSPSGYFTLVPQGAVTYEIDLLKAGYDVGETGTYDIDLPGRIEDVYGGSGAAGQTPRRRQWKERNPAVVYCGRSTITVVKRP